MIHENLINYNQESEKIDPYPPCGGPSDPKFKPDGLLNFVTNKLSLIIPYFRRKNDNELYFPEGIVSVKNDIEKDFKLIVPTDIIPNYALELSNIKEEEVKIRIPAGVATGNYLTRRGEGNRGPRKGPAGDLIIIIEEEEHEHFERHGNDILYNLTC